MRRVKLLFLGTVLVLATIASTSYAQESAAAPVPVVDEEVVDVAEDVQEIVEEVVMEEPAKETVAEVEVVEEKVKEIPAKVEEAKEKVMDATKAAVKEAKTKAAPPTSKASSGDGPLASVKSAVKCVVDKVVSKSKSLLEKTKKVSKSDMKKVAAAGLGIWGVAVGVGYLTQPSPAS